jgi:anti-sigma regulatory factor (Ser/Thr protein kinase)
MSAGEPADSIDSRRPAARVGLVAGFAAAGLHSLRAAVSAHAAEHGMDSSKISKLLVVASELAANAIRHGGGQGQLRLWQDGDALHCEVTDDGPGIGDASHVGTEAVPLNADGGRGLWIVRQFSDQLSIVSHHPGTTVTATLHL